MSHPFVELGVKPVFVQALEELKISSPTEVQRRAIPFLTEKGTDLVAQAQTGTGKTAAFGLPLLARVDPRNPVIQGVVIAPTRELAKQIGKQLFKFTKYVAKEDRIFCEVLCGGDKIDRQVAALQRPTHLIVATPGRLLDMISRKALNLDNVKYLVLDEADEMLSLGFKKELGKIFGLTRGRGATWLFSATFPESIKRLVEECMAGEPEKLTVDRAHQVNRDISHRFKICDRGDKVDFITRFLKKQGEQRGLIFARTRAGAINLGKHIAEAGFSVEVLQGDLTQLERDKVMRAFKKERLQFLIATDVAARGIDVESLAFVLHHQLPDQLEYYTHRAGRTARAGRTGVSLVLIEPREKNRLKGIERALGVEFSEWG